MDAYVLKTLDCLSGIRLRVVAVAVLAASCGGGTLEAPPQSPDPPSVEAAVAEIASVEAAVAETASVEGAVAEAAPAGDAVVDSTAVEVPTTSVVAAAVADSEAPATAVAAPSTAEPAAASEPPIETTAPFTTMLESSWVQADESVLTSALEVMLMDLGPSRVVLASFFYGTEERVAVNFCLEEPSDGGVAYRHVQRVVDLEASQWEVSSAFDIQVVDDLESCVASFN